MKYLKLFFTKLKSIFKRKPSLTVMGMDMAVQDETLPVVSVDMAKLNYNRWRA